MNIKEGIEKRFSVRAFTDEVPKLETIKEILKTANAAPSGGNIQPWKVYVLSEKAKKRLAEKTLYNFDNGVQEEIEYDIYPKPLADEYKKRKHDCGTFMSSFFILISKRLWIYIVFNFFLNTIIKII